MALDYLKEASEFRMYDGLYMRYIRTISRDLSIYDLAHTKIDFYNLSKKREYFELYTAKNVYPKDVRTSIFESTGCGWDYEDVVYFNLGCNYFLWFPTGMHTEEEAVARLAEAAEKQAQRLILETEQKLEKHKAELYAAQHIWDVLKRR